MLSVYGPQLAKLTTLRVGGQARALVTLEKWDDLERLPWMLDYLGGHRVVVMGQGSNLLAHDGKLDIVLVRPVFSEEDKGPQRIGTLPDERVLVNVGAGLPMRRLLNWAAEEGLGDITGLCGIPGRVGGAVAMNAGSYGCELGDVLHSVQVFSPEAGLRTVEKSACEIAYRHFAVPGTDEPLIITGVVLALMPGHNPEVLQLTMRDVMARKKATQPVGAASAGCVFKNPPGQSAGKLLDEAGFRGRQVGGMALSAMHANFLVNTGGGTATEALTLLAEARDAVCRLAGVELSFEVKELAC